AVDHLRRGRLLRRLEKEDGIVPIRPERGPAEMLEGLDAPADENALADASLEPRPSRRGRRAPPPLEVLLQAPIEELLRPPGRGCEGTEGLRLADRSQEGPPRVVEHLRV